MKTATMKIREITNVYAYGRTSPMTKEEIKQQIREFWGNGKRLPYGTQIWKGGPPCPH